MMTERTHGKHHWETHGSNGADSTRTVAVYLLHEMVAIRTRIESARRLFAYNRGRSKIEGASNNDARLDLMIRISDEVIANSSEWLSAQIVALHDPVSTTQLVRGTPPRTDDD